MGDALSVPFIVSWVKPCIVSTYGCVSRISGRFFENQPNEICIHLSEKAEKGRFLKPHRLQNHTNEGKAKERKRERGGRKEEKRKKQWLHS